VPLTVSMEMLAEAGAALFPEKLLVGMRNIRAYRWMAVPQGRLTLEITAQLKLSGTTQEVDVQIKEFSRSSSSKATPGTPLIEGTMVFADAYPNASSAETLVSRETQQSKWTPSELYSGIMFHGPMFQGVVSIIRSGEEGTEGTLRVLATDRFFRSK